MRTSTSLTSFLTSLRGYSSTKSLVSAQLGRSPHFSSLHSLSTLSRISIESISPHVRTAPFIVIPKIRIYTTREPIHPYHSRDRVHRWCGFSGFGDGTLHPPGKGLTSCARSALARQGYATGSFRLNCSESVYAWREQTQTRTRTQVDVMEKKQERNGVGVEVDGELETMKIDCSLRDHYSLTTRFYQSGRDDSTHREKKIEMSRQKEKLKQMTKATTNMRFNSYGLSSCATFTSGLSSLEDYFQDEDSSSSLDMDVHVQDSDEEYIGQLPLPPPLPSPPQMAFLGIYPKPNPEKNTTSSSKTWLKPLRKSFSIMSPISRKFYFFGKSRKKLMKVTQKYRKAKSTSENFTGLVS